MQFFLAIGRALIESDWARALVLKGIRAGLIWLGPVAAAFLLKHGADASLVNAFVSYLTGAVLSGAGIAFSLYDAKSVRLQMQAAVQTAIAKAAAPKTDAAVDQRLAEHAI